MLPQSSDSNSGLTKKAQDEVSLSEGHMEKDSVSIIRGVQEGPGTLKSSDSNISGLTKEAQDVVSLSEGHLEKDSVSIIRRVQEDASITQPSISGTSQVHQNMESSKCPEISEGSDTHIVGIPGDNQIRELDPEHPNCSGTSFSDQPADMEHSVHQSREISSCNEITEERDADIDQTPSPYQIEELDISDQPSSDKDHTDEELNDTPIEQVRLTVPSSDDPSLPCLTFRTWILGVSSCAILSTLNQYFRYRQKVVFIAPITAQIVVLPIGRLMAAYLPKKLMTIPKTKWSFSMNPGPFNTKEHVLITTFANLGSDNVYATTIITMVKAYYKQELHPLAALFFTLSTQMVGYGWVGLYQRFLVDSPNMWWPSNLVQVSIFRALHEVETRPKGGLTRCQFLLVVVATSFVYYIIPGYLFPSLASLSLICWIGKNSITAQQIGSGFRGLGIGSVTLDWGTIAGFLSTPLASPRFVIINTTVGFILFLYILIPAAYWTNLFEAQRFPLYSSAVFDSEGQTYDFSRVLNDINFSFNQIGYNSYSRINLSIMQAFTNALNFATLAATVSHFALFHGKSIWQQMKTKLRVQYGDVHTKLMKKNYESVPHWWFFILLMFTFGLAMLASEGFNKQLQLPYWGVILSMGLGLFFTLPIGVLAATTNQRPGLNLITEMIIGYIMPGKSVANAAFKTYGTVSTTQAIKSLSAFKLGHYMKIPPKSMFVVQLVGVLIASACQFSITWWLVSSVENICQPSKLPQGSPWTCPAVTPSYDSSILWGVVGPIRVIGRLGNYSALNYFTLFGILSPLLVWVFSRIFPEKEWIPMINMPVILGAANMPPIRAVNNVWWLIIAFTFNFFVYYRYRAWWARHNYLLSAGIDSGVAFMSVLISFIFGINGINGIKWWGTTSDDHCPLAHCPTAAGIRVEGCPVRPRP